jgi:type IV pilus assembly protein PilY1
MRNLRRSPTALVRGGAFSAIGAVLGLGGLSLSLALPREAAAQTVGDVKLRAPNVLLLVDTSGSMNYPQAGPYATECDDAKTRWVILLETLTGTVNGLDCDTGSAPWNPCHNDGHCENGYRILSNGCSPTGNSDGTITAALNADPYAWPYRNGGGKNKDAVGFQTLSGGWCWYNQGGGADWSQQNDGILDIFGDKIRFGLMTFDAVENARNWNVLGAYTPADYDPLFMWSAADNHNARRQQDGNTDSTGAIQNSYWWDGPANNWVANFPTSYAGTAFFPNSHGNDLGVLPYAGTCTPVNTPPLVGFRCDQTAFDLGAKNSRARPWRGRLLGFGNPEASVPDTVTHNEMVQLAVIGHSRYFGGGTPLSALMRDAYEFILKDTGTVGVQLPQLAGTPVVKEVLGPLQDPYIWGSEAGCRSQHVLVVTDGEPSGDYDDVTMATHARNLYADSDALASGDPVNTYVIGVGMDNVRWTTDETTVNSLPCKDLTATHLTAGNVCERSSNPLQWKYADECGVNGSGGDCREDALEPLTDNDRSSIRACCTILETAIAGRAIGDATAKPYFPQTQAELKTFMSDLISNIAGGTLSRTVPVFAASSGSAIAAGTDANSFEIRSSLLAPPGNGLWEGKLERIRWKCTGGTQPYTPGSSSGDDFAFNLKQTPSRKFFTVTVENDEPVPQGSIRPRKTSPSTIPDPNVDDCLYGCGNPDIGDVHRLGGGDGEDNDVLFGLSSLKSEIDNAGGIRAPQMMDLENSDRPGCDAATGSGNGANWDDRCAERVLKWYGGDPAPGGITTSRNEALGGIYKSTPVIVDPPKAVQEDELFSNERSVAAVDTDSFVKKYGERPTMLYAQSVDGQLHAFVVNANTDTGPFGAPSQIPSATTAANNELWTFIPPAVLPALWKNFDAHARLSDGPITVADVALSQDPSDDQKFMPWRSMSDVQNARGEYRTIMVVSGGPSVLGGLYYALDVTNPKEPRFLWQLSSAGRDADERVALFGDSVPGAAITTLRLTEPGRGERMVPVAILSGGGVKALPTGTTNRRMDPSAAGYWDTSMGHLPRTVIRDWGDSVPARSVTVVELYSGRIIMRMGGQHCDGTGPGCATPDRSDHPLDAGGSSILHSNVVLPNDGDTGFFDSPMTSQPMPFPSGPGKIATRVYVGDADGTMWRLDLSNPNPKNWTAKIAFDAYNFSSTANTMNDARIQVGPGSTGQLGTVLSSRSISGANTFAIKGQPINNPPIISLDAQLQTTVSFATGDNEGFQLESPDAINVLVTFVDYYDPTLNRFRPYVNRAAPGTTAPPYAGIEMAFMDGAGVTGPLNLFDGQLMFAYFLPRTTTTCTFGKGGWCAPKFLEHTAANVPDAAMDLNGSPGSFELCNDFTGNEVVFGIQINQKPSCLPPAETYGDPWLAGSYKAITTSTTGAYEIVMHTGQGGAGEGGAQTKSTRKALKTPKSQTFVQSWVNAIE